MDLADTGHSCGEYLLNEVNKILERGRFVVFAEVVVEGHLLGVFLPDFGVPAYGLPLAVAFQEEGLDYH